MTTTSAWPIVLRGGVVIEDPLSVMLGFLARWRLDLSMPAQPAALIPMLDSIVRLRKRDPRKTCYCENVKNITVSVPDDVYRNARVAAAQRDTSVSALVVAYLEQLSGRMDEFTRLEALQREVQAGIGQFRAADRLSRDEAHDRAVR